MRTLAARVVALEARVPASPPEGQAEAWAKWRSGDMAWKLHADQLRVDAEIEARQSSREVLEIARKWGKTWYLMFRANRICQGGPKRRYVYGAPTYKHLQEFVVPVIDEFFDDAPPELKPVFRAGLNHLEFPNGSWVHFFGADDKAAADRGRGPKADEAAFDESGFCPVLSYVIRSVFRPSLLLSGGKTVLSSSPAEEPDHDFTTMAEIAEANGSHATRTIYDNPMLSKEQVDKFIAEDARDNGMTVEEYVQTDEFRREYLAERVIDKLLVVMGNDWELSESKCVRESVRPKFFDAYGALDMGGGDPHAHSWGYLDFARAVLVIEYELLLRNGENTAQLAEAIKAKEREIYGTELFAGTIRAKHEERLGNVPEWISSRMGMGDAPQQPYLRVADNDLLVIRDLVQLHDLVYVPTQKDNKDLQVNNLRILVRSGRFEVHPRCVHTIRHLRSTVWENNKRKTYRRKAGEHGDLLDTAVYMARNVDFSLNPFPLMLNVGDALELEAENRWAEEKQLATEQEPDWKWT